ncbi:beta-galactosidase [Leekyejoonella antrihumi]|uniref:Beta-galactosidase n=1 Tax=Leekyejoonella antrihumi TaxID=1660198 RepID=A0A563DV96_9MICO|nr:beta-galactosidase [Leekyejoonella antrihumi]TWP34099.1 beta-galactosidase [Leekyejoonella antrihumi]
MDRRQFLILSALTPAAVMAATPGTAFATEPGSADRARSGHGGQHSFGFAKDGSAFLLDGAPFQIRSGEMHPSRIPVEYWQHRIQMAKAMGMNTISLYVMWNYIEETPGHFDFRTDRRNFVRFIELCQQEGMWVLLRPGPYVCGEWDLGGIPPYLLRYPDIKLRVRAADDPHYMAAVTRYYKRLVPLVKPLLVENGGPVLMIQVENEYGSYGNSQAYVEEVRQLWVDGGITGPFYTEDGLGQVEANHTNVPGGAIGLSGGNAGSIEAARKAFPDVPAFGGEVYPGWLTHWGDSTFAGETTDISPTLQSFMDNRMSFNLYMIHGGTSFGYWAGANADNYSGGYQADITSYDYSAPITEQGRATAHYTEYRNLIAQSLGASLPKVPASVPTIAPSAVTPQRFASIWDNLPRPVPARQSVDPQPMEMYGQSRGYILYRKQLDGYSGGSLDIQWVHDYATVFMGGAYMGGLSRQRIPDSLSQALNVTNGNAPLTLQTSQQVGTKPELDIFVEGMGHTNYGQALVDRKGILESASLEDAGSLTGTLTGWNIYLLPMDEKFVQTLRHQITDAQRPGQFFRAAVRLGTPADTYVDMSSWTKGVVWVNGHNIGRYWEIGPQHRLYCPASWLKHGHNEIVVFDLHQVESTSIGFEGTLG